MTPRFSRSRRFIPHTPSFNAKPSRLTLGTAAATVAVAAGIAVAVSASPGPAPAAFSGLAAVSAAGSTQTGRAASHTTRLAVSGLQSAGPAAASASKLPVIAAAPQPGTWPTGAPGATGQAPAAGTARSAARAASPAGTTRAATAAKPAGTSAGTSSAKPATKPATGHAAKPATGHAAGHAAPGTARVAAHAATRTGRAASALRASHHARPGRWYSIYDSVTPGAIPAHHAVATYATGNYAVSRHQVTSRRTVLWIDTTGYDYAASILDVEPGDATPTLAAQWAWHRLHRYPHSLARIYTMMSEWPAVKAAVAGFPAPLRARIRWWIADPTGQPHIVPGADATQWYWGNSYDITLAKPRF